MTIYNVEKIIEQALRLAAEYRAATGKPLPVSAEIANFDAARFLGLELVASAPSGYDAVGRGEREGLRYQIKGRAIWKDWRSYVKATSFVCKDCGYLEEWVESAKEREELPKEDSIYDTIQ